MKERIITLLGAGIRPVDVAVTVGCDISYVTQVSQEEQAAEQIASLKAKRATDYVEHDATIDAIEKTALDRIQRLLPMETNPMRVLAIFKGMNGAQRRGGPAADAVPAGAQTVILNLPNVHALGIRMTTDRQIVEVEGRSMVPMPSQNVAKMLREKQADRLLETTVPVVAISNGTKKSIADML